MTQQINLMKADDSIKKSSVVRMQEKISELQSERDRHAKEHPDEIDHEINFIGVVPHPVIDDSPVDEAVEVKTINKAAAEYKKKDWGDAILIRAFWNHVPVLLFYDSGSNKSIVSDGGREKIMSAESWENGNRKSRKPNP